MGHTRLFLLATAFVLVVLSALALSATAETTRVLTITTQTADPESAFAAFDGTPTKVFDFDGDGDLEIIAQNDNRYVYVFDSQTGALLAELLPTYPASWGARPLNGPEVAILVHGGVPHVVVANSAAMISAFRLNETRSNETSLAFDRAWERRLTDCHSNPGMDSKPVLADIDGDGDLEILAQTEEVGVYALQHDGRILWKKCIGGGNAEPGVGDLDGDGSFEVVWVSDAGVVMATSGRTGSTRWTFWAGKPQYDLGAASMPVGPAVAQLDGKGGADVVVGARDSSNATNVLQNHAALFAIAGNGSLLWMRQENVSASLTYTHPIVYDIDANGQKDVFWADWNTEGHKPGNWNRTGPAHVFRYDAAGTLRWMQTVDSYWHNKDLALADVDADGTQEVLANGPSGGHDGIWYLSGRTGAKETFVSTYPWKVMRAPIVADLSGDGSMQWVVSVMPATNTVSGGAILVYDTGSPYDSAWPHLPYAVAAPGPPPPVSTGTFEATFTIKNPNAWWQEVTVKPDTARTLSKVEVRVNGDGWRSMTKSSWGPWTSSVSSPAGSRVEFLATDSAGKISQSLPFTWLDGNLTKRSTNATEPPPPPPPGAFNATFDVPSSVNEWWVEVKVRTGEPLSGVDVRVNGGGWIALSANSWGSWSKSLQVKRGSSVEFRATSLYGDVALSPTFAWLSGNNTFTATFMPKSQTNNWWVEVDVDSTSLILRVEVRVGSGAWQNLNATSWGNWAKSFFVADGSVVTFRATNDVGNVAVSDAYVWG